MLVLAWKSVLAHRTRLVLSLIAVVLGVGFVAGTLVFTDMMSTVYQGLVRGTVADLNVRPAGQGDTAGLSLTREISAGQVAVIRGLDGVESAEGSVLVTDAYPLTTAGKVVSGGGGGAIGMNWILAPSADGDPALTIVDGRAPQGDEVVVDPGVLQKGGYRIGDRLRFAAGGGRAIVEGTIVGTGRWASSVSSGGSTYIFLSTTHAQRVFLEGRDAYTTVWVALKPGAQSDAVATRLRAVLPSGYEVVDAATARREGTDQLAEGLALITTLLVVFAATALIVGSFLILNTFAILVAQRVRELGLLRALGASRRQVRRSVLLEAVLVGLVGSALGIATGLVVGLLISRLFGTIGVELVGVNPSLSARTVLISFGVGIAMTALAGLRPARRASSTTPMAALTDRAEGSARQSRRRVAIGLAVTAGGLVAMVAGWLSTTNGRGPLIGLGVVVTFVGVLLSSPVLARPVITACGALVTRTFGEVGRLATVNSLRNPQRTAATAAALTIGLTLVTLLAGLGATIKEGTAQLVRTSMRADYLAQNANGSPFSPEIADAMAAVPGVTSVDRLRYAQGSFEGVKDYVTAMDGASFDKVVAQRLIDGSLSDYRGQALLVDDQTARARTWSVGELIPVDLAGVALKLRVAGVYATEANGRRGIYIPLALAADVGFPVSDYLVGIHQDPGADPQQVRRGLEQVVAALPLVTIYDKEGYVGQQAAYVDTMLTILYGLLALAILIALLGVVNTVALSVVERTREMGLLRAIGLTRRQQSLMIVVESVVIASFGGVLGVGLGSLFTMAIVAALRDSGLEQHVLPWAQIGAFLIVTVLAAALAALWPSVRAARLNVLRAIATQ